MSDSFLSIGDASSAEAVASDASSVEITGGNGQESSLQNTAQEAGATSAPVFDPQTAQPETSVPAHLAGDDWESTRAEAQKQLENEYAPRWYRDTIRKYETKFGELSGRLDQLNNQPAVSQENLKLYEAAKDFQLKFLI